VESAEAEVAAREIAAGIGNSEEIGEYVESATTATVAWLVNHRTEVSGAGRGMIAWAIRAGMISSIKGALVLFESGGASC
jgi:hypothetical protein